LDLLVTGHRHDQELWSPNRWPGKTMGNPWETHGKTMGNPWENHGKPMGKPWETMGKAWENHGEMNSIGYNGDRMGI